MPRMEKRKHANIGHFGDDECNELERSVLEHLRYKYPGFNFEKMGRAQGVLSTMGIGYSLKNCDDWNFCNYSREKGYFL